MEEGENATSVDVDIPLSKLYTLSGTVLRPDSESPANGAQLSLTFADTGEELTSTDVASDDGSFRFDFCAGGNYVLRATRIANVERNRSAPVRSTASRRHILKTKVHHQVWRCLSASSIDR